MTIGIHPVVLLEKSVTLPPRVRQLRDWLDGTWRHQKIMQSEVKRQLREIGWTILDNCSRRYSNSERTFPREASSFILSARVSKDEGLRGSLLDRSVVIHYSAEDFLLDLCLLQQKFSGYRLKVRNRRDVKYVRPNETVSGKSEDSLSYKRKRI